MASPLSISVIIPSRNRAHCVLRAIKSALAQRGPSLEVIVVDDASTDDTLVRLTQPGDPRLRTVRLESHCGAQVARKRGLDVATGDWIGFLDSDDWYLPGALARLHRSALAANVDVVCSEGVVCYERVGDGGSCEMDCVGELGLARLLRAPGPMFQGMLLRRESVRAAAFLDPSIEAFQEWDASIELARRFALRFVEEPSFVYNRGELETISKDPARNARGYEQIVTKHRRLIEHHLGADAVADHFLVLARMFSAAGLPRDTRRCAIESLRTGRISLSRILLLKSALGAAT